MTPQSASEVPQPTVGAGRTAVGVCLIAGSRALGIAASVTQLTPGNRQRYPVARPGQAAAHIAITGVEAIVSSTPLFRAERTPEVLRPHPGHGFTATARPTTHTPSARRGQIVPVVLERWSFAPVSGTGVRERAAR